MRVVVSVDIEGATGIVSTKETTEQGFDYEKGREYLTRDVNAAIEGALEGGATYIELHDSHGLDLRNLIFEKVHPAAEIVRGTPILFFEDLQPGFDACFLVAAHSSYDQPRGVLNHLFSSVHHKSIKLNGTPISEGEISAAIAGHLGIPTVLVTGDDVACAELQQFIPEIETAVVKYAISRFAARCLPFAKTEPLIREAAKRAILNVKEGKIAPYTYKGSQELTIELNTPYRAKTIANLTNAEYLQPTTIKCTASDAMDVYRLLSLVLYVSNSSLLL